MDQLDKQFKNPKSINRERNKGYKNLQLFFQRWTISNWSKIFCRALAEKMDEWCLDVEH